MNAGVGDLRLTYEITRAGGLSRVTEGRGKCKHPPHNVDTLARAVIWVGHGESPTFAMRLFFSSKKSGNQCNPDSFNEVANGSKPANMRHSTMRHQIEGLRPVFRTYRTQFPMGRRALNYPILPLLAMLAATRLARLAMLRTTGTFPYPF